MKTKTDLEIINENLPLIPKNIPVEEKIKMAEKKIEFIDNNAGLFRTSSQYIMTLDSVKRELKEYKDAKCVIPAPEKGQ